MNDLDARIRRAYDAADPVELADVHQTYRVRRRRRRVQATAVALVIAVAASVAVLSQTGGRSSKVHVTVADPTTTSTSRPTSKPAGSAEHSSVVRGGITVRFVFDTPTVEVGGALRGWLVVTTRKAIRGCPAASFPLSVTGARTGQQGPGSDLPACATVAPSSGRSRTGGPIAIPAGTTSYRIRQTADYQTCSETQNQATKETPYCDGATGTPNLPPGRYKVAPFVEFSGLQPPLPTPPVVALTITAADGSAA
jgi:hypothetical protein